MDIFINNADVNLKLATLATKSEIKAEQDKILQLKSFDSSYFRGKSIKPPYTSDERLAPFLEYIEE